MGLQALANRANRTDVSTGITNQNTGMNNAPGPVYRIVTVLITDYRPIRSTIYRYRYLLSVSINSYAPFQIT